MSVTLTQIVTLTAFATHVVMGCCAHHQHRHVEHAHFSTDLAHIEGEATSPASGGHNACLHQHSHAVQQADDLARAVPPSPCGHDHPCVEGHCAYLPLKVLKWTSMAPLIGFNSADVDSRVLALRSLRSGADHTPDTAVSLSSATRCALQQSWQI